MVNYSFILECKFTENLAESRKFKVESFLNENYCPSPDRSGYPFAAFFRREKIKADSRNSS
jgi:hypothetical protein